MIRQYKITDMQTLIDVLHDSARVKFRNVSLQQLRHILYRLTNHYMVVCFLLMKNMFLMNKSETFKQKWKDKKAEVKSEKVSSTQALLKMEYALQVRNSCHALMTLGGILKHWSTKCYVGVIKNWRCNEAVSETKIFFEKKIRNFEREIRTLNAELERHVVV